MVSALLVGEQVSFDRGASTLQGQGATQALLPLLTGADQVPEPCQACQAKDTPRREVMGSAIQAGGNADGAVPGRWVVGRRWQAQVQGLELRAQQGNGGQV